MKQVFLSTSLLMLSFSCLLAQSADKKIEVIRKFYQCFDSGKITDLNFVVDEQLVDYDAPVKEKSFAELQGLITTLHDGFSNVAHELEQIHIVGKDKVVVRWKMTAKHTGTFFGIPASGKTIEFNGHDIFTIKNEKIIEQWHVEELLSLINQISSKN
jgi:predicted ester cyclase